MELYLNNVEFESDIFTIATPDGGTLVLNKIDESLRDTEHFIGDFEVKRINIEIITTDDIIVPCSSVIGYSNVYMEIRTDHKELEGAVLTAENMQYCTLIIYE